MRKRSSSTSTKSATIIGLDPKRVSYDGVFLDLYFSFTLNPALESLSNTLSLNKKMHTFLKINTFLF